MLLTKKYIGTNYQLIFLKMKFYPFLKTIILKSTKWKIK